ncbi:hypothetical protein [Staphylococcus caeli]|uniref:hypothetical protein n=1 Tax=Staphylococcus caeli TaxID=2201815 RepID=UPI003F57E202
MKHDRLTHILLLIVGLLFLLNGAMAFDTTLVMLTVSLILIILGLVITTIAIRLMLGNQEKKHTQSNRK